MISAFASFPISSACWIASSPSSVPSSGTRTLEYMVFLLSLSLQVQRREEVAHFRLRRRRVRPEESLPGLLHLGKVAQQDPPDCEQELHESAQEYAGVDDEVIDQDAFHRNHLLSA